MILPMEYMIEMGLLGLFISAFLAATILPLSSEAVLSALLINDFSLFWVIGIATVGNVLGAFLNYGLGYWLGFEAAKKWLKMTEMELNKAEKRFQKYGLILLCFAWVPVIGDPITVVAGVLRLRFVWFFILVTAGKLTRYCVVAYFVTL